MRRSPRPEETATVAVTAGDGCEWTASSNAAWITVTAGASGSGNGTVAFSVAPNPGAARTGTISIAGHTFTVNQAAAAARLRPLAPMRSVRRRRRSPAPEEAGPLP